MAKQMARGNCLLWSLNGHFDSLGAGVITILGIVTFVFACVPDIICASTDHLPRLDMRRRVPLHSPADWFRLRISITGVPILS